MKHVRIAVLGILGLGLLVTALLGAEKHSQPSDPDKQVACLTGQVRSLQAKIQSLEERLHKLEKEKDLSGRVLPSLAIPPAYGSQDSIREHFADPNHPPKIWGEGECNGWKYYVIPVSGHGLAAGEPTAQALIPGSLGFTR